MSAGGGVTLVIDGVDEGLAKVPEFVDALTLWLAREPVSRIRVVMMCRLAEWDGTAGDRLMELWPESERGGVFELCPLREEDARLAAVESGIDPDSFIAAVRKHTVDGLAARPLTLRMLIDEFRRKGGFPESHRALFLRATERMASEIDPERARRVAKHRGEHPPEVVHRVTCRIAALLMTCGRSAVFVGAVEDGKSSDLLIGNITGGIEVVNGRRFEVTPELTRAALDTPLFTSRGAYRFGFDHPTFAECLAAAYLKSLTVIQLRKLLFVSIDGREYAIPQLAEVSAWLAISSSDWSDCLIASEPEVLF